MTYEPTPAVVAITANCKRLIRDAELLLSKGSPASASSLAILAFEEAGKGHYEELGFEKTKRTPGWHQFRQIVAAFVLQISVLQKYGVKPPVLPESIRNELKLRHENAKTISEAARRPIPAQLHRAIEECARPAVAHLTQDEAIIADVEFRWTRQLLEAAAKGEIEEARQRGMYVDVSDGQLTSNPADITHADVYRWLFAASRALLLLECGDQTSPYSPLAARLESRVGTRPKTDELRALYSDVFDRVQSGEDFADVYLSTLPESERAELTPVLPTLRSMLRLKIEQFQSDLKDGTSS